MLYTYYVIYILLYILVYTYYVINGINIIKYLHNGNYHNGGKAWYIATLCATVKGVCVCVASCYAAYYASYTLLVWAKGLCSVTMQATTMRGHRLGLGVLRCVPHSLPPPKKICVFLYSQIAGCLAVAGISFYGF